MTPLFELLAVLCLTVLPTIPAYFYLKKVEAKDLEKHVNIRLFLAFFNELGIIFVLLFIGLNQPTKISPLGIDLTNLGEQIFAGIVVFSIFVLIYALGYRIIYRKPPVIDYSRKDVQITLAYRTPLQRILCLINSTIAAIAEELVLEVIFF